MPRLLSRRELLKGAAAGAGFWVTGRALGYGQEKSPNAKLNVACIGVAGRGRASVDGCKDETIAALCDVDRKRLEETAKAYPGARLYADFRKMLETEKTIDAVTVGTPDHLHAPASVMAMKLGRHVYCEKPLAHTLFEARTMAETAARMKVVTQMGNQLHSTENVIRPAELLQAGILGAVGEVHSWSDKAYAPGDRPKNTPPVPENLDWDLWLGPAPERPYHPAYVPFKWRGWWDFGTGNMGDMACHIIDPIAWGLNLGSPNAAEVEGPEPHPESCAPWRIARYNFPAREGRGAVKLTWYDGMKRPPADLHPGVTLPDQGSLVVGEKGTMLLRHGNGFKLLPESKWADVKLPEPVLARPAGHDHHGDWIRAIKTGGVAGSAFAYASALTEIPLLGNVAYRAGKKLEWNSAALKAKNCPEADRFIHKEFRKGWTL
jgi:predicted dehydrogenase